MRTQSAGDNKPTGDQKDTATNKPKPKKKKSARHKTPSKNQIMKQIKQNIPKEYQGYLQQGAVPVRAALVQARLVPAAPVAATAATTGKHTKESPALAAFGGQRRRGPLRRMR